MHLSDHEDSIIADLGVAMKFKFSVHRSKGGWSHKSASILMEELKREVVELEEALASGKKEAVISEAADVANYLAMIIEKVKK